MQGILTNKPAVVCHNAALFLIGVSAQRVQRVLEGQEYGRKKGLRLPNDSLTSGPMHVCLRFLWRKYHFDAEGLPDKFSIERHDMTSMTVGAQGHPNRTTIPARSALHPLWEVGPNQDEVLEEEERAIASMALYIASAHEPILMVSLGPGAHGGLARYIGVMKPVHLYFELEGWRSIQEIPKASFNTLLRAFDKCGCV